MIVRPWPDWLDDIWAKSPDKETGSPGESLAQHTWNVLERLAQTISLRPNLPDSLGCPWLWNVLFWACWLHDWGKAARGFQERLRGGPPWPHRHEVVSLAFVDWLASAFSIEETQWLVAAIASHHLESAEIKQTYSTLWLSEENVLTPRVAEIPDPTLSRLWKWLTECAQPWVASLGLDSAGVCVPALPSEASAVNSVRVNGADRARHWLKSYIRFVKDVQQSQQRALVLGTLATRGTIVNMDHAASAHAGTLPNPVLYGAKETLSRLGLDEDRLYDHQLASTSEQRSVVLSAPTGSGKTEAALLWASSQLIEGKPTPRLFYILPYQASMNAMYDRFNANVFPGQVGLEHSRSVLALYRRLLDGDGDRQGAVRLAKWQKNLSRLNHYPVRILSPYQMLKAPYRLKGYESLLSDFFHSCFVLDEVHAYEAERLAIILATVKYLREQMGARFFVMSATMPALLRKRLTEALGDHASILATPQVFVRFQRHRLEMLDGDLLDQQSIARLASEHMGGQSVLVACNTVKRAQQAYHDLKRRIGDDVDVILLHGRFNGRDRLIKERAIQSATGSRSADRKPVILVGTQVVEVSLDIDLDVIYTDPAPLEALIQRFGRVNRRMRKEWAPVYVFTQPADGQGIYEQELVASGLRVLDEAAGKMINEEEVSDWLDRVYQGDTATRWNEAYSRAYEGFTQSCLATFRAFNAADTLEQEFYKAFDSVEVLPACREQDYLRHMADGEPLEASELLVPVSWRRLAQLRRLGKAHLAGHGQPWIVDCPYDSDVGLRYDSEC